LGVDVKVGEALDPVCWRYESAEIRLRPHLCEIIGGVIEAMSHERVDWFAIGDLRGLDWAPADVPILTQIESLWG
jgi:8-oxo-dGTP diphosphatase